MTKADRARCSGVRRSAIVSAACGASIALALAVPGWAAGAAAAASSVPSVFWASDPVEPGQTVLIEGDQLDRVGSVSFQRVSNSQTGADPSGDILKSAPLQAGAGSLKVIVPPGIGSGIFRYWFENDRAHVYALNAPTVYWAQGDRGYTATPGGWIRIFGRNILRDKNAHLELVRSGQSGAISLQSASGGLWDARFVLPGEIRPGSYKARIWNGNGDRESWREAGQIEIAPAPAHTGGTVDVGDFGARGDGVADDTDAFRNGLKALSDQGGGTLKLKRGYYKLSDGLVIPDGVRIKGEDRALVRLIWTDFPQPPFALLQGSSDFEIEDVSLVAFNHGHIISGGFRAGTTEANPDARNIAIRRVTIRASMYRGHLKPEQTTERLQSALKYSSGGPDSVRLSGQNLVIEDSDIYGSGRALYLNHPRGAYIAHNRFYNGRWGWYSISGADRVIFEDNDVIGADLQSTGGGINTLRSEPFAQNVAFFRNRFSLMHGWDREAMTSDGPGGCFYGAIADIDASRTVMKLQRPLPDKPIDLSRCRGAGLFILGGRGAGQVRRVQEISADGVSLDRPFDVDPDSTSIVSVTSYQRNYLLIDNEFSDAGIAVQLFGSAVDHVAAGNLSRRTGGFLARGLKYGEYQPVWFSQFLNNRIEEGDIGRDAIIATWGSQRPPNKQPLSIGTIIRGNRLDGAAHIEVRGYAAADPGVRDVVIENNTISNAVEGIVVDRGATGVMVRDNVFHNVQTPIVNQSSDPR